MHNAYVDVAKAKQDAEWMAGSTADTAERNLARAFLEMTPRGVCATCHGDGSVDDLVCPDCEELETLRGALTRGVAHLAGFGGERRFADIAECLGINPLEVDATHQVVSKLIDRLHGEDGA